MAVILLGLTGYLFWIEIPQGERKKEAETQAQKVVSFNETDIQFIGLQYRDPEAEIDLTKSQGGKWVISRPIHAETDEREIAGLLSSVVGMRHSRVLEDLEEGGEFGFDQPQIKISLTQKDSDGEKKETILVGDDGPIFNTLFVKRESDQQVVLVEKGIKNSLTKKLFDLRNKKILPIDRNQITQFTIDFKDSTFLFVKEENQWKIRKPQPAKADSGEINGNLFDFEDLRAIGFVDSKEEKEKLQKNFKVPELMVRLKEGNQTIKASIFKTEKGQYFAVTSDEKPVYEISKSFLDNFKNDFFIYRDKHLLVFDPDSVKEVSVKNPEDTYYLRKAKDIWTLEGDEKEINQVSVTNFLKFLESLEAEEKPQNKISFKEAGLQPPLTEIELKNLSGVSVGRLQLGKEADGKLYAQGLEDLGITLVFKSTFKSIPQKIDLFKGEDDEETEK